MSVDADWLERAARSAARVRTEATELMLLPAHASTRRYARVALASGATEIAMLFPPEPESNEAGGPVDDGIAGSAFARAQRWLHGAGVRVPACYAADEHERVLWLEDLGPIDFDTYANDGRDRTEAYHRAVVLLDGFQRATQSNVPAEVTGRRFDRALLRWELDHYIEWRLQEDLGLSLAASDLAALNDGFERLLDRLVEIPTTVVHRDFQSHNIMVVGATEALALIDFQDAMVGPVVYDAVALLRDSYVELTPSELATCLHDFATRASQLPAARGLSVTSIVEAFHLQTLQRKLKDAGRFVYIDRVRGNPSFLRFIPSSLRYVRSALAELPAFDDLAATLAALDPELR
jgi:N-acetylmuramate 1-kinase